MALISNFNIEYKIYNVTHNNRIVRHFALLPIKVNNNLIWLKKYWTNEITKIELLEDRWGNYYHGEVWQEIKRGLTYDEII